MSFHQPDELTDLVIAGVQVGDTSLMTPDGIVHLPTCRVFKRESLDAGHQDCSCGAKFAKASEFIEQLEIR